MKGTMRKYLALLIVFAMILSVNLGAFADVLTSEELQEVSVESPNDNDTPKEDDESKESYDELTPAKDPITDPNALPPGTVSAIKTARWVDYANRIAEINLNVEGMPIISGSDVILVMDVSGSMGPPYSNRIDTAQDASIEFIDELLGNGNPANNRVAFIPFEGDDGGAGSDEVANTTNGSVNFSYDTDLLEAHVNATVTGGGTNYSAALQKAINYANSRLPGEESRPLYVVFMSDGAPGSNGNSANDTNWNGTTQASTLMGSSYNATIYTVGIQLTGTGTRALENISSTADGVKLYQSVSDMDDLSPVLTTIVGQIKKAGTLASFKDYISEYFNYYNIAPYDDGDGIYDPSDESVNITVGDILEEAKTFKIYVQLKSEYWTVDQDYPTNNDIKLNYIDVDGNPAEKDKDEIGHPEVSVGYGTIKIKYVLVNSDGEYIDGVDGVEVGEAYRVFVPTTNYFQNFEFNGSTQLEVEETYSVVANVPVGYSLYSGETSTKIQELTTENRNATVEFKVVESPMYTVTVNYVEVDEEGNFVANISTSSESKAYGASYDVSKVDPTGFTFYSTTGDAVTGTVDGNKEVTHNYTRNEEETPSLSISKSANRNNYTRVGEKITYTITVKNTGNVTLTEIEVRDPMIELVGPDGDTNGNGKLDVGETWRYTGTYLITRADINSGKVLNIASVDTAETNPTTDSETIWLSTPDPVDPPDDDDDDDEIIEEPIPEGIPELNKVDHFQYIQGYPDNTVRPEGLITREEVAAVFYRLLAVGYRESIWTLDESFSDVASTKWSLKHIATLANGGIIEGYPDGSFRPGNFITRAELATIASRFDNLSPFESNSFSDIAGHWANRFINSSSVKGWVNGYPDGTFKPDQYITRAEFVTLVNNVLERRVHAENILPEARSFPDLPETKWYYEAMQEAIDSHKYLRLEDTYEEWIEIYYPILDM